MSLIISCQWHPPPDADLPTRTAEVRSVLAHAATVELLGADWYRLGRSKKDARRRKVSLDDVASPATWRRRRFGDEECDYVLALWNGRDEPVGASLSVELHQPSVYADTFALDGPSLDGLAAACPWQTVLECARAVAVAVGGMCVVSSHELVEALEARGAQHASMAAYAAFWGADRSAVEPAFMTLGSDGGPAPDAVSCAASWSEALAPDWARVGDLAGRLSGAV